MTAPDAPQLESEFWTPGAAELLLQLEHPGARLLPPQTGVGKHWRLVNISTKAPVALAMATLAEKLRDKGLVDLATGQLTAFGFLAIEAARAYLDARRRHKEGKPPAAPPRSPPPAPSPDPAMPESATAGSGDAVADAIVAAALAAAVPFKPPAGEPPSTPPPEEDRREASDPCPVLPLGKDGNTLWLLSPSGEVMRLDPKCNANALVTLFDGEPRWLIRNFPRCNKDGDPIDDFVVRDAFSWLVRQCKRAGIDDASTPLRGLGVFHGPKGPDGRAVPIAHVGDAIFVAPAAAAGELPLGGAGEVKGGTWRTPGWRSGRAIYIARPAIERPDLERPATPADGERLRRILNRWSWQRPYEPGLYMGQLGLGLLGGYPSWRVHCVISAERGSGKTKLLEATSALFGPMARDYNNLSEAGARAALANEGRVLLLDEAENEGGALGHVARLIGLLRRMSGGEGAKTGRGSPGQQLHEATVTGCAILAGITPPPLEPADRSRIIRLDLRRLPDELDPQALIDLERDIEWVASMSAAFRARVLLHWPVFAESVVRYRASLIARKCDSRQADVLAALLAGRELLLHDEPPSPDEQDAALDALNHHILSVQVADDEDGDAQQCLNHLLSAEPTEYRDGRRTTIGNLVALALAETSQDMPFRQAIMRHGLRLVEDGAGDVGAKGAQYLLIANRHGGLSRIFTGAIGQRWAGGNWTASLRRLGDDVRTWHKKERFAGAESRGIAIPVVRRAPDGRQLARYLPEPDLLAPSTPPPEDSERRSQGEAGDT